VREWKLAIEQRKRVPKAVEVGKPEREQLAPRLKVPQVIRRVEVAAEM
jgi:hypothetical protein